MNDKACQKSPIHRPKLTQYNMRFSREILRVKTPTLVNKNRKSSSRVLRTKEDTSRAKPFLGLGFEKPRKTPPPAPQQLKIYYPKPSFYKRKNELHQKYFSGEYIIGTQNKIFKRSNRQRIKTKNTNSSFNFLNTPETKDFSQVTKSETTQPEAKTRKTILTKIANEETTATNPVKTPTKTTPIQRANSEKIFNKKITQYNFELKLQTPNKSSEELIKKSPTPNSFREDKVNKFMKLEPHRLAIDFNLMRKIREQEKLKPRLKSLVC